MTAKIQSDAQTDWPVVASSVLGFLGQLIPPDGWTTIQQGTEVGDGSTASAVAVSASGSSSTHRRASESAPMNAAVHLVQAELPASRSLRLGVLSSLWRSVEVDGYLALSFNHHRTPVTYGAVVQDLLEASLGRVGTAQMTVHPDPLGGLSEWATVVWTRLGL